MDRFFDGTSGAAVSYTHLRAHETPEQLVCRLLLEKKNNGGSTIVFNEYKISPVTVSSGLATYPADSVIEKALKDSAKNIYSINATNKSVEIGSVKTMNVIL